MFCSKCGKKNKGDATVCVQCGATLGKQESPVAKKSSSSSFWKKASLGYLPQNWL
jgi:uncharacterized membrane protein YvbJ